MPVLGKRCVSFVPSQLDIEITLTIDSSTNSHKIVKISFGVVLAVMIKKLELELELKIAKNNQTFWSPPKGIETGKFFLHHK